MSQTIVLKKGLDIPIKGVAALRISKTVSPDVIAIKPSDFKGLSPRLLVREGDPVMCGSPVMADKNFTDILITSPVSGKVKEIVRGDKRKLLAVLIENDHEFTRVDFGCKKVPQDAAQVKQLLLSSGMWPWFVQRPYGILASPVACPKAIFVSAFNTAPLAADAEFCHADEFNFIQAGVNALAQISKVHVSVDSEVASAFTRLENCEIHSFKGKHPAGNVGVQISHIAPIRKDETVWTVSPAGLSAIGKLLRKGRLDLYRAVAVTGPMAIEPSYVRTIPGMSVSELAGYYGNTPENIRIISGDPLSGRKCGIDGYLGFFDTQVTMINEGTEREWFGWIRPLRYKQFSTDHCYFSWLTPWRKYDMDTNIHGGQRAFVMSDPYYRKVLPMDIFPIYLAKACLAGDIDRMERFGIYEVLPEDLALCEFIDPCKNEIQDMIAKGIDLMRKEMA
mgnify:CR=1 FL=1